MARIVELIETWEMRGRGTEKDPCRMVQQWYKKDGTLLFEKDFALTDGKPPQDYIPEETK
jgi:hypothetical protein